MVFKLQDNKDNLSGKELSFLGNSFSDIKDFGIGIGKADIEIVKRYNEQIQKTLNPTTAYYRALKDGTGKILKCNSATQKLIASAKGGAVSQEAMAASLSTMTLKAHAAAFGMQALKLAGNMAAGFIAGMALNFAIEQITHLVNAQKEAIEKANEISSAWKSQNEALASNKKVIDDISSDYELLSKGVNQFGQNISLTSEEYSKYNDIVNQIADMFPTMVQGYTDEGNAILVNKGNVEALTKAYEEQKKAAQDVILVGSEDAWKGFSANFSTNKWLPYNQSTLKAQITEAKKLIDQVTNQDFSMSSMHGNGETKLNFSEMIKSVGLREIGIFESYGDYQKYLSDNINTIVAGYNTLNQKAQTATTAIKPILSTLLDDDNNFQGLTEEMQGNLKGIFSKFDFNFFSQFDTKDAMYSWVSENFILPLTDSKTAAETQSAFASLFSLDKTAMPYGEWKAQAELLINTIADALGLTGDDRKDFIINIGFKTDELDPSINAIDEQMSKVTKEQIELLTDEEIRLLYTIENKGDMTFDEAKVKIKELQAANTPIISPISNAFKPFADDMDKIQSAYQTMSSTISEYNQKGYLTIDNMQAIMALGDDYIGLLFNENGQIKLNKDGYIALANAQLDEMEAKALAAAISNVQALTDETTATEYLTGKTKANTTATDANAEAKLKLLVAENLAKGGNISLATKQITDTFAQYKAIIDATRASLGSYTDETMGATNATKAQAEALLKAQGNAAIKSLDKRIDGLQKQLSLLDKQYEAEDALLALEKAKDAYENTKSQKTQRVYYEDRGFVWEANQGKLAEAQESIKKLEKEQARKNAKKAIQDEIDSLQDLKKKYQESMSHIGETLKEHMLEMELTAQFDGMSYEQMATYSDDYTARVIANLNAEAAAIANRNAVAASGAPSSYDVALPDRVDPISFDNKKSADEFYNKADEYYGKGVVKKYKTGGVNDTTGLAQLDGDKNHVETVFNSTDGKKLYDAIHHAPDIGELLWKNLSPHLNIKIPKIDIPMPPSQQRDQALSGSNTSNIPQCVFYDAKIVANNDSELFKRALNYAKIHNKK